MKRKKEVKEKEKVENEGDKKFVDIEEYSIA